MTDENLKQKAQELKDHISNGIRLFRAQTGLIPGVDIIIKTQKQVCKEDIVYVDVTVKVDL